MVRIPKFVFDEVDDEVFINECKKMMPFADPKFKLGQLVHVEVTNFKQKIPAVISSIEVRNAGNSINQKLEWSYKVVRPRNLDGVLEQVGPFAESEIKN